MTSAVISTISKPGSKFLLKIPAYRRHKHSGPMWIVGQNAKTAKK